MLSLPYILEPRGGMGHHAGQVQRGELEHRVRRAGWTARCLSLTICEILGSPSKCFLISILEAYLGEGKRVKLLML